MSKGTEILSPVGRLVAGNCFEGQTTDPEGRPLVVKNGANAGQSRTNYYIGLAVAKNDPGLQEFYAKIAAEARAAFPQFFDAAGQCNNPKFAMKVTDGDSTIPNTRNVRPCDREGFPGHFIFHFSNGFAPKCYTKGGTAVITNPEEIKRGYYIRVYGMVKGNESVQQPGVFLNHSLIELVGYGEEIISGPSGDQVFGGAPVSTLPAGASATPLAPRTPIATPGAAPMAGLPAGPQPALPSLPGGVKPAPDFLNPPPLPVAPPPAPLAPPAPPAPPVSPADEVFIAPNGARVTRAQLLAASWTEPQILTLARG